MTGNSRIGKTVRPIFSPAIYLLNRIGFTGKFALLWLVSLVATAVVVQSLFASLNQTIHISQRELQGLALVEPVSRTVQLLQQHRGISAALLGGNETMQNKLATMEKEAIDAFDAMEGALPPRLTSGKAFLNIRAAWQQLLKEGLQQTADKNFAAHTSLIEQITSFRVLIADDFGLMTDNEITTYYLIDTMINKYPHALEHLGQLRAYGTSILSAKKITQQQKIKLHNLIAELGGTLHELSANIEKTSRYNLMVRESLETANIQIKESAEKITSRMASDILSGKFATPADNFLDIATEAIDHGYAQIYQVLLPVAGNIIGERIARAETTLYLSIGIALLLLLLAVYISASIYYATIGSIRSLVDSAHAFAGGDLSQRVRLNTHDELSLVGDSFNKMADGLYA
ncbi:MAG: HAMP domain-containing protein [Mariprofundaceae bacterium]|nr:HAMP domain-containing protein [Mariprofundaceae bacterium]